jgi:hypothetical protein
LRQELQGIDDDAEGCGDDDVEGGEDGGEDDDAEGGEAARLKAARRMRMNEP